MGGGSDGRGGGFVECPQGNARTRWRKCWVGFFSCLCWLDSGHRPDAPGAPPGRSWVLSQSPRGLRRARKSRVRDGARSRAALCPGGCREPFGGLPVPKGTPSLIGVVPNLAETVLILWIRRAKPAREARGTLRGRAGAAGQASECSLRPGSADGQGGRWSG